MSSLSWTSSISSEESSASSSIFSGIAPSSKTSSILIVSSSVKFSSFSKLISSPLMSVSASASVLETITEIIAWTSGCNFTETLWIPSSLIGLSSFIWFFSTINRFWTNAKSISSSMWTSATASPLLHQLRMSFHEFLRAYLRIRVVPNVSVIACPFGETERCCEKKTTEKSSIPSPHFLAQ